MPHTQSHKQTPSHKRASAHHAKAHQPRARKAKATQEEQKNDALSMLSEDHQHVKELFAEFEQIREQKNADEQKKELVREICIEFTIHAKTEEELFYPVCREVINDEELLDEAEVEHDSAKELVQQLQSMNPSSDHYDAKVIVLREYINHHVNEEETKIFPQMQKSKIDLEMLGEKIAQRKEELHADMGEVSMSMLSKM
jgi:hemerythrin superfamily protein